MPDDQRTPPNTGAVLRYRVEGMDCPNCAGTIETVIKRLPGTGDVRVNYQSQVLALRLDEAATPRGAVKDQIRSLGYGVSPVQAPRVAPAGEGAAPADDDDDGPTGAAWWQGRKARLALLIGALILAAFAATHLLPAVSAWAYTPAALLGLWFFGRKAIALARAGSPFSIEMLMSVATVGAILIGAEGEAAVVVLLFTVGEVLEGVAAQRARAGIQALASLVPKTALLVGADGTAREVPASRLEVGQIVLVRPGDRVSSDGQVVEGESEVDESPVTGESVPRPKRESDPVYAGSINTAGALQVRVTRAAADNTIARIIHLVEEAQAAKAPTARFIERFSAIYTPAAVAVSALVVVVPPLLLGGGWYTWLYRGLGLLLVACPCALVLSTPAAVASGLAAGARRGLLVKGGAALEAIGRVRTIAFDKTGTLTRGRPEVTDLVALAGPERAMLGLAAAVENGSSHPIGRAILERAAADGVPLRPVRDARAIAGRAVEAVVMGKRVMVSSPRHAAQSGVLPAEAQHAAEALEGQGRARQSWSWSAMARRWG